MYGIINVLKPPNMTSHDVVGYMRRLLGIKKIGHTGTLDPNAAGVLPICIGKATRVAEYFNDSEVTKTYRGELTLGKKTDTLDSYGRVIGVEEDISTVTDIEDVLGLFRGHIEQKPPMYSAKKQNGKKLYELAREGIEVERKSREVEISRLELLDKRGDKHFFLDIDCSSGTYIRVLFEDIAESMGTIGYMSFLLRTRVGDFNIEEALTIEELSKLVETGNIESALYNLDFALKHYKRLDIDDDNFDRLVNGIRLKVDIDIYQEGLYRVYCRNIFIGMGAVDEESRLLKMKKVLYQG